LDRVSYERCCCGLAIPLIYDYLHTESKKKGEEDTPLHEKLKVPLSQLLELLEKFPEDQTINKRIDEINRVISQSGLKKEDKVCERVLDMFVSLYGAETGNLALKVLPYGGIYLLSTITNVLKDNIIKEKTFIVIYYRLFL
jgi:glucokinase